MFSSRAKGLNAPGHFAARKERRYQPKRRLDGPQSPSGRFLRRQYVLSLSGFVTGTVHSVDIVNTDCTIPALSFTGDLHNLHVKESTVTVARHKDPVMEMTIHNPPER